MRSMSKMGLFVRTRVSALFLLICCAFAVAQISIDLGSENLKVALLKPGREPISIALNEISKRKTTAAVAVIDGRRYVGEKAFGFQTKQPEKMFTRIRDFLGRNTTDKNLNDILRKNLKSPYPWKMIEDSERGTVRFETDENSSISVEELTASLLHYSRTIAEAELDEKVQECVIAVPAFFGPVQKQALLDAAKLVDLKITAIVNAHASAALQYGIDRVFDREPQDIIFYDMGANSIQVSLISFSAYEDTKKKTGSPLVNQFEVKDVCWEENLGGDHLDWILVDHFANIFNNQFGLDLYKSPKAIFKLKNAVRKTKHVLSTNTEAPVFVEELYMDKDFRSVIKREEFESLAAKFFENSLLPLKKLLNRNKIDASKLAAIELIGGGTRVPKLKEAIADTLGGRTLDKHLDGDEAVTMGAGLVAANFSSVFRLREFGFVDGAIYPITLQVDPANNWTPPTDFNMSAILKPKALVPWMKHLPSKRLVQLNKFTPESFTIRLLYNTSENMPLPPGAISNEYAKYRISGLGDFTEKYGSGGRVLLHFTVDISGLITFDKAEYWVEYLNNKSNGKEAANATLNSTNGTVNENSSEETNTTIPILESMSSDEFDNITILNKTITKEQEEGDGESGEIKENFKLKLKKLLLDVDRPVLKQKAMSVEQIRKSKNILKAFVHKDQEESLTERLKNELESYILEQQALVETDEKILKVTREEEIKLYLDELIEVEDWLYTEGVQAKGSIFTDKLKKLKAKGDEFVERAEELSLRDIAVNACHAYIELIRKATNTWPETKPFINATEIIKLNNMTDELEKWLNEVVERQGALEIFDVPAFKSREVYSRIGEVEKSFQKLGKMKPPRPPRVVFKNITGNIGDNIKIENISQDDIEIIDTKKDEMVKNEELQKVEL